MTTSNTLLAYLSKKFTHQTENVAVEALGHILSSSEAARSGLTDVLRDGGVEVGDISSVVTQPTGEGRERPDLACYISGAERVLIEAKFWAGLTEHQPVTYLKRLPKNKPSTLLFVAPEARFESLWTQLRQRVENVKDVSIALGETTPADGVRSASVGDARVLMMTSWATLFKRMESRASDSGDESTQNDIQQLMGLAVREDEETLLPMRGEQLGPEFPRFVFHMNRLVDDAATRAESNGLIHKGEPSATREGYRRRIELCPKPKEWETGIWYQWLSVDFRLWRRYRETPLWIVCPGPGNWRVLRKNLETGQKSLGRSQRVPLDFIDEARAIPVNLRIGVEYEAVLDDVVQQIKSLSELLKNTRNSPAAPDTT